MRPRGQLIWIPWAAGLLEPGRPVHLPEGSGAFSEQLCSGCLFAPDHAWRGSSGESL